MSELKVDWIMKIIEETVKMVFGNKSIKITSDTTALDVDGWNSLSHMIFMTQIERQFDVSFSDEEIFSMGNIGELAELIGKHLEEKVS